MSSLVEIEQIVLEKTVIVDDNGQILIRKLHMNTQVS